MKNKDRQEGEYQPDKGSSIRKLWKHKIKRSNQGRGGRYTEEVEKPCVVHVLVRAIASLRVLLAGFSYRRRRLFLLVFLFVHAWMSSVSAPPHSAGQVGPDVVVEELEVEDVHEVGSDELHQV